MGNVIHLAKMISIHAPREGSDPEGPGNGGEPAQISIHAPRGGSDHKVSSFTNFLLDFNPRSP